MFNYVNYIKIGIYHQLLLYFLLKNLKSEKLKTF